MKTDKQKTGRLGEHLACLFLLREGYFIRALNYRAGQDEIDIIAQKGNTLAFIEVKTRRYTEKEWQFRPSPAEAVGSRKEASTRRAAGIYLRNHPTGCRISMDVFELVLDKEKKLPRVLFSRHLKNVY